MTDLDPRELELDADNSPWLTRLDWSAFWVACVVALGMYVYTLAPTVSLEDSGELAVAADYLGVPHPPGYPLWSFLGWIFARVFAFKKYMGQPNPSWGIGFMSAFFGALSSGIIAMLICSSGRHMLASARGREGTKSSRYEAWICFAGGVAASLLFAFCPIMWSQSVIVEVYSLNVFFVSLLLLLMYLWLRKPSDLLLYGMGLSFGLGMANWWPSIVLTLPLLVLVIMLRDTKLFRDFAVVGVVIVGMVVVNLLLGKMAGAHEPTGRPSYPWASRMSWGTGPRHSAMWVYVGINCAALALSWFFLPKGKVVTRTFLFLEIGLLFYLYMPIVSDLRNPPMNWAYPRMWEGFVHAITRGQYAHVEPTPIISSTFLGQIGMYASDLRAQFTLPIVLLGFLPFTVWRLGKGRASLYALVPSLALAVAAASLVAIARLAGGEAAASVLRTGSGTEVFKLFIGGIVALVGIGLAALVLLESRELAGKLMDKQGTWLSEKVLIGLAFLVLFGLLLYFEWGLTRVMRGMTDGTGAQKLMIVCLMVLPLFVLGSVAWLLYGGLNFRFDLDRISRKWMLLVFLTFVVESVVMISFASPGGEIQEMFIQRVKFVGSHGVFSIFIGYGLIMGLAFVGRRISWHPFVTIGGLVVMLALPVYPIVQNAPFHVNRLNKDYLLISGGASQRGHDFGWQFGNYQLRGMEAILEEMSDEEKKENPPPNPHWPPPMGPRAVFFGGTDPGRFVPTYMIFSGKVRSDVFLITQNALADKTYMSVMRDLYGDEIWIPSIEDHRRSFAIFNERYGGGKTRGDRMIVSGVQKVMQINGILCKMIHDNNRWKHDFYVEESYPIDWMYEYMEPHGLILKINKEKVPKLSQEVIKNDLEFWAWYSDRLVNNKDFRNDACARKTFAKLRGAIAGMYERRAAPGPGRPPDQQLLKCAEQAYLEGIKLCPISQEAIFRLAGFYQKLNRIDDAIAILEDYKEVDAKSAKVLDFITRLKQRRQSWQRMTDLKAKAAGGLQLREIFELMGLCRAFGDQGAFIGMIETVLKERKYTPDVYLRTAKMCSDVRDYGRMNRALQLFRDTATPNIPPEMYKAATSMYAGSGNLAAACEMMNAFLARRPTDFRAWQELAAMNMAMKKEADALTALRQAVRVGADASRDAIRADKRFASLKSNEQFRKLIRSGGVLGRL